MTISGVVEKTAIRAGISPLEAKRFVKFGVVGVIGAVVDFGVLNILRVLLITPEAREQNTFVPFFGEVDSASFYLAVAVAISFVAAIISNFFWNRFWTYPDSHSKSFRRQFAQFFLVNCLGVFIRVLIVALTHVFFGRLVLSIYPPMGSHMAALLGDNMSVVLAVGIVMFWNFFVNRYWTYADVDSNPTPNSTKPAV